jgi:RNA polymerase sigma factor (sigma-70 family)
MTADRLAHIAAFYAANERRLRRVVQHDTHASSDVAQDACQTAWTILLRREDIPLDRQGFAWLCKVARTTGLRNATGRETPAGAFLAEAEHPAELPEPPAEHSDPLELALAHEQLAHLRARLLALTERERRYLALKAAGLSYREIAAVETGVTLRTIERQILRGRRKLNDRG